MKVTFEGKTFEWDECLVPKCKRGKCYRLDSEFCYPHTKRLVIEDARVGNGKMYGVNMKYMCDEIEEHGRDC